MIDRVLLVLIPVLQRTISQCIARQTATRRKHATGFKRNICSGRSRPHIPRNLDLLDFPTLIFGQTGYSIYVLRQASRRSWRIGRRRPVKVKFLQYTGTMQESCLRLMGKKLLVSLAMEGKFAAQGLQALEDDDDILTAMARELVTQKGVGEKAEQVWRELQASRAAAMAPAPAIVGEVAPIVTVEPAPGIVLPEPVASASSLFGLTPFSTPPRRVSRRGSHQDESQLSLAF